MFSNFYNFIFLYFYIFYSYIYIFLEWELIPTLESTYVEGKFSLKLLKTNHEILIF